MHDNSIKMCYNKLQLVKEIQISSVSNHSHKNRKDSLKVVQSEYYLRFAPSLRLRFAHSFAPRPLIKLQ